MQLSFSVINQTLTRLGSFRPIEGSINYLPCTFTFESSDWDGTTKSAIFEIEESDGTIGVPYVVLLINNQCSIPVEVLKHGMLSVSVVGTIGTTYRIPTDICYIGVGETLYDAGNTPQPPTTMIYEQLAYQIEHKGDYLKYSGNTLSLLTGGVNGATLSSVSISGGSGGSIVTDSTTNGNILVDGLELVVYTLPNDVATTSMIPTKTSDLANDSHYVSDTNYVHTDNNFSNEVVNKLNGISSGAQANVIEKIESNGTELSISNKTVDIIVPTKTSDLTNDDNFITAVTAPVTKVNNKIGDVTLTTGDIEPTASRRYVPDIPLINPSNSFLNGNGVFAPVAVGGVTSVVNNYLSNTNSTVSGYKTVNVVSDPVATIMSVSCTSTADVLSYVYLYPSDISITTIDSGIWESTFNAYVSNTNGITRLKIVCFVRHADGTETDLFVKYTDDLNTLTPTIFYTETNRSQFSVVTTDRLGFRIYGNTNRTSSTTIYYTIGGENPSYINTPLLMRHSQLRDLNGLADYQHMTAAQVAKVDGLYSYESLTDVGNVSKQLTANKFCVLTYAITGLTLSLPTTYTIADIFDVAFTTGSTWNGLTLPSGIVWSSSTPTFTTNAYYEIRIRNNKATVVS